LVRVALEALLALIQLMALMVLTHFLIPLLLRAVVAVALKQ
jgi:hypothetical protein